MGSSRATSYVQVRLRESEFLESLSFVVTKPPPFHPSTVVPGILSYYIVNISPWRSPHASSSEKHSMESLLNRLCESILDVSTFALIGFITYYSYRIHYCGEKINETNDENNANGKANESENQNYRTPQSFFVKNEEHHSDPIKQHFNENASRSKNEEELKNVMIKRYGSSSDVNENGSTNNILGTSKKTADMKNRSSSNFKRREETSESSIQSNDFICKPVPVNAPSQTNTTMADYDDPNKDQWKCVCETGFLPPGLLKSFGGMEAVFRMSTGQCYHKT